MNVLVNAYVGKKITGIGNTLIQTIKHITIKYPDVNFTIYTNFDNYEIISLNNNTTITVKTIPVSKLKSLQNLIWNSMIFPFITISRKYEFVYYPNFIFIPFKFNKTVCVIHDMIEFRMQNKFSKLRQFYRSLIVPRMARLSDHIITVSNNSKADIVDICKINEDKITVIYDGVNVDAFNSANFKPIEDSYILHVGTVDYPGKNVLNAMKAFELYKEKSNDIGLKFIVCGMPGKDYSVIEDYTNKSKYRNDFVFKGYVDNDSLHGYYLNAKCFIFISYYEGFGLPVIEAQACNVPVITSNRSCLPEIVGSSAIICDPDDIESISQSYETLINDTVLRDSFIHLGNTNIKRFAWDETANKTYSTFTNLINK